MGYDPHGAVSFACKISKPDGRKSTFNFDEIERNDCRLECNSNLLTRRQTYIRVLFADFRGNVISTRPFLLFLNDTFDGINSHNDFV